MKNKWSHIKWKVGIWLTLVACLLVLYFFQPEWFNIDFLQNFVANYKIQVVLVYLFILSILGLFLIPSTPFAVAGVLLFSPAEAYVFNIIGIITSSALVYYFAQYIGLDELIKRKYPKKLAKVQKALAHKELPIIIGWSFFPVVPTDLIIYVASTFRIPFKKCLWGVLIGEGLLNIVYIFFAQGIL